ncbi:phosphatidylinositol N-acetylglucosaminyltransferase subunit H [Chlorella sorokiniana]|uniref:Phosphatidylinositol N-acetylglucosaminyltransferase subunit H n=1 Tax=Chlorella sorokiniana TaxID=3076 RepID=A0A2P6TI08_CHLSO|nr:phosphatidylinositol N-acetylglucosaminyltransferase subunit H [Chlorella sorokiniana]|eukprot:PRW33909.1 phosphatidylinositol N-acetylglucosaminyltransferase subunit H [Chlorella sorokiniana]
MSTLRVLAKSAGSVEWRVEAPSPLQGRSLAGCALGGVLLALLPAAWLGASWQAAALAGGVAAAALALLHTLLAVQWESLTYVRLLGVRLESRRRCGLGGTSLFLPLRMLQGLIIHEEVSATRADFYLALPLQPDSQPSRGSSPAPANGSAAAAAAGGDSSSSLRRRRQLAGGSKRLEVGEDCEVQVVFPRLRPRLSLLRQVYQQLSPVLAHDLEAFRTSAEAQPGAEQLAAVPAAVPLPQPVPPAPAEIEESELSQQIEEQRLQQR